MLKSKKLLFVASKRLFCIFNFALTVVDVSQLE